MDDSYIISFTNGSSGRFVKYILYSLLTDYKEEMRITKENSAHLENFYTGAEASHLIETNLDKQKNFDTGKSNKETIYSFLEFDSDVPAGVPKIFQTHAYPEFEIIQKRLPDTKLILINLEEDDWLEAVGNCVYKNAIALLHGRDNGVQLTDHENNYLFWLKDVYLKVVGVDIDLPFTYDIEETKRIVYYIHNLWKKYKSETETVSSFINPIADFEKYPNLTLINYKELYKKTTDGSYVALEKLEKISNKVANAQTFKNYEKYVKGRENFVRENMPWISGNYAVNPNN
jgi:hypothetical protein